MTIVQVIAGVIGYATFTFPQPFHRFWLGGMYGTIVGFVIGFIWHSSKAPPLDRTLRGPVGLFALISFGMFVAGALFHVAKFFA